MSAPYLLLDCYLDEVGAAPAFVPQFGGRALEQVRVAYEPLPRDLPAGIDRFAGVVVTGSAASVLDGIPWVQRVLRVLQEAAARQVPMLGVCFGHQAIAQALVGAGAVRRTERPEVGWHGIEVLQPDPLFAATGPRFTTFLSHEDEVVDDAVRHGGLVVLARSRECAVQAIRVPSARIWGVQFHPELPYADCEHLVLSRARRHPQADFDAQAMLSRAVDSSQLARDIFGAFFAAAAPPRG